MKLVLKWLHNDHYSGPALHDENGEMLPGQVAVSVEGELSQPTHVTVKFNVDRIAVVIDGDAQR